MIKRYPYRDMVWVDVESPTPEEVRYLVDEFDLPALVAEDLLTPTFKPRVDHYHNCIYLILHFPAIKHTHGDNPNQEVDFVIGRNFLITTRYDTIDPMHKFSKVFEVNSILNRSDIGEHAGYIFFYMAKKLYKSLHHEIEYLNSSTRYIEERVFGGHEREMVEELSQVGRMIMNFRHALTAHENVLISFEQSGILFFGESFRFHMRSIAAEYHRVAHAIENCREIVFELRETNNSLITTKQNEIMKILTIMAFVTFPLSLIAAIFGMNTVHIPIIGMENDFWIVIGGMALVTILMFAFFKHKKWL